LLLAACTRTTHHASHSHTLTLFLTHASTHPPTNPFLALSPLKRCKKPSLILSSRPIRPIFLRTAISCCYYSSFLSFSTSTSTSTHLRLHSLSTSHFSPHHHLFFLSLLVFLPLSRAHTHTHTHTLSLSLIQEHSLPPQLPLLKSHSSSFPSDFNSCSSLSPPHLQNLPLAYLSFSSQSHTDTTLSHLPSASIATFLFFSILRLFPDLSVWILFRLFESSHPPISRPVTRYPPLPSTSFDLSLFFAWKAKRLRQTLNTLLVFSPSNQTALTLKLIKIPTSDRKNRSFNYANTSP
jgi:hypothetical protein